MFLIQEVGFNNWWVVTFSQHKLGISIKAGVGKSFTGSKRRYFKLEIEEGWEISSTQTFLLYLARKNSNTFTLDRHD